MQTSPRPTRSHHVETGRMTSPDPGAAAAPVDKWIKHPVENEGTTRIQWRRSPPMPMETVISQVIEVLQDAGGQGHRIRLDDLPQVYERKFNQRPQLLFSPSFYAGSEDDPFLQALRSAPYDRLVSLEHDTPQAPGLSAVLNAEKSVRNAGPAGLDAEGVSKNAEKGPNEGLAPTRAENENEEQDVLGHGEVESGVDAHVIPAFVEPVQVAGVCDVSTASAMPTGGASPPALSSAGAGVSVASPLQPTDVPTASSVAYLRLLPSGLDLSRDAINLLKLAPLTTSSPSTPSPLNLPPPPRNTNSEDARSAKAGMSEASGLQESTAGKGEGAEMEDKVTASLEDLVLDNNHSETCLNDRTDKGPSDSPPHNGSQLNAAEDGRDENGCETSLLPSVSGTQSGHGTEEEDGMSLATATVEDVLCDDGKDTTEASQHTTQAFLSFTPIGDGSEKEAQEEEGMTRATASVEGLLSNEDEEIDATTPRQTQSSTPSPLLRPPPGFEHLAFLPSSPSSLLMEPGSERTSLPLSGGNDFGSASYLQREGFNASGLSVIDMPELGQGMASRHLQNQAELGQASADETEGIGEKAEPTPEAAFCWQLMQALKAYTGGAQCPIYILGKTFEKLHGHAPQIPSNPTPGLRNIQIFVRSSYPTTRFLHLADDNLNLSLTYEGRRVSEAEVLFPPPNPNPPAEPLKTPSFPEPLQPNRRRPMVAEPPPKDRGAHPLRRNDAREQREQRWEERRAESLARRHEDKKRERARKRDEGHADSQPPPSVFAEPLATPGDAAPSFSFLPLPLPSSPSASANASSLADPWIPLDLTELGLSPAPLPLDPSNATNPPAQAADLQTSGYLPLPDDFTPAPPFPFTPSATEPTRGRDRRRGDAFSTRASAPSTSTEAPAKNRPTGGQPKSATVPLSERIAKQRTAHQPPVPAPPPTSAPSPLLHTPLSSAAALHQHLPPHLHVPSSFLLLSSSSSLLLLLFPAASPPLSFLLPNSLMLPFLSLAGVRALLSTHKPIHKFTFDLYSNAQWVHASDGLPMPSLIDLQLAAELTLDSAADTAIPTSSTTSSSTAEPPRWVTDACDLALLYIEKAASHHSPQERERVQQATARRLEIVREQGEADSWLQQGFRPRVFVPSKHRMVSLEAWEVDFSSTAEGAVAQHGGGPVQVHDDTQALLDFLPSDLSLPPLSSLLPSPSPTIEILLPLNQPPRYRLHPSLPSSTKAPLQSLHSDPHVLVTLDHLNTQLPSRLPPLPSASLYPRLSIPGTLHRVSLIRSENGVIVSATIRSGRYVTGQLPAFADLLLPPSSFLLLGPRGSGKSTLLREMAAHLSITHEVIVIDAMGEIGGDGDLMHHSLRRARRMAGAEVGRQAKLITDALRHTADVVVIDEISSEEEVGAIASLRQRGVIVIAGVQADTYDAFSDHEVGRTVAKDRQKASPALLDSLIACHGDYHKWTIYPSNGPSQTRRLDPNTGTVYILPPPSPITQA